jgi:hypothetical protein
MVSQLNMLLNSHTQTNSLLWLELLLLLPPLDELLGHTGVNVGPPTKPGEGGSPHPSIEPSAGQIGPSAKKYAVGLLCASGGPGTHALTVGGGV